MNYYATRTDGKTVILGGGEDSRGSRVVFPFNERDCPAVWAYWNLIKRKLIFPSSTGTFVWRNCRVRRGQGRILESLEGAVVLLEGEFYPIKRGLENIGIFQKKSRFFRW